MFVEDIGALGVDVKDVESAGALAELGLDAAEEGFEDGGFEGVKEKRQSGSEREFVVEDVLLKEEGWGDPGGCAVGGVGGLPEIEVGLGYVGHGGVKLDANDLMEGVLTGEEHGSAFACTDVDEGVVEDGVGWWCGEPVVDEGVENAGGDTVVGRDVGVVGVAGNEVVGGDEAAGFGAVDLVEGMDGRGFDFLGFAWGHGLADLNEGRVTVETEDFAASGGDVLWGPGGSGLDGNAGLADGFEAGEAVGDLGAEMGFGVFSGIGRGEGDGDDVFLGDAPDSGAGGLDVRLDGDGVDEAEVDYVAGDFGVVAVAQGLDDLGLGEHLQT